MKVFVIFLDVINFYKVHPNSRRSPEKDDPFPHLMYPPLLRTWIKWISCSFSLSEYFRRVLVMVVSRLDLNSLGVPHANGWKIPMKEERSLFHDLVQECMPNQFIRCTRVAWDRLSDRHSWNREVNKRPFLHPGIDRLNKGMSEKKLIILKKVIFGLVSVTTSVMCILDSASKFEKRSKRWHNTYDIVTKYYSTWKLHVKREWNRKVPPYLRFPKRKRHRQRNKSWKGKWVDLSVLSR